MDKSFDELFNEFFNPRSSFDAFEKMREDAKKFFESVFKASSMSTNDENLQKEVEKALGEPDEIKHYIENGFYFEERIWHTKEGSITETIMSDDPNLFPDISVFEKKTKPKKEEKPLELQLKEALEKEDYEKAAEIRDLMNPPKKKRGRPKKVEK
jgi:excinuclease UvrABC helicase subunit UvrB